MGGLLHVLAAALGLSLLVAHSAVAFNLLKYVGAAYLIYLGVIAVFASHRLLKSGAARTHLALLDFPLTTS